MFEGAHTVRFDRQGDLWYIDAADNIIFHFDTEGRTLGTLGTNPEPWTYLTHVIERAVPGRASLYQETDIGWSRDGSHVRRRRLQATRASPSSTRTGIS